MAALRFENQTDASRWALFEGDSLASVIDYRDDGRSVVMTRVFTPPPFRGQGHAAEIVKRAVAEIEQRGDRTVVPVCWYAAGWFDRHPEHAGILEPRSAGAAAAG